VSFEQPNSDFSCSTSTRCVLLIPLLRGGVLVGEKLAKFTRPCLGGGWAKQAACSLLRSWLHVVLAPQHYLVSDRLALWAQMYVWHF